MQNISLEQLTCKESCNQKLWVVITDTENFTHIFNKYPNLINSTILYFRKNMSLQLIDEFQASAVQFSIRSKISNLSLIRNKILFLKIFFEEIGYFQVEKQMSYEQAWSHIDSLLLKIGNKHYDGSDKGQIEKMLAEKFPFEVNSTRFASGESRDFDVFLHKPQDSLEIEDLIDKISNLIYDPVSNTKFKQDLVLFFDPYMQKKMLDRVESMDILKNICKL